MYEVGVAFMPPPPPLQDTQAVVSICDPPSYLESVSTEMQLVVISNILTDLFGADGLEMFSNDPVILFSNLTDKLRASLCTPLDPSHPGMVMVQEFLDE